MPEFFEALHGGSRSTRIANSGDTLMAIVNDVAYEFSFDPSEIESLWLNVARHVVVSAGVRPLHSVDRLRSALKVILRDVAALQERIRPLQEEIAAQVGEQTSRSLFTLTVVTVLALPINIVAGLLGMNVGGIPLAQDPHGFHVIVALVLAITALAAWLALCRRG